MRKAYDFSKSLRNPYAKRVKKQKVLTKTNAKKKQ